MEKQLNRTFATPAGCDLVVENVKGQIVVEGWDRPETEVNATYQESAEIEISQDGNKVIARTKGWPNGLEGLLNLLVKGHRAFAVDYVVHVPYTSDLCLKNVNGPVSVTEVQGNIEVNNVDGSANLDSVQGQVKAETVNGSLQASALQGEAQLKTVNGKLEVSSGTLDNLSAETVNGHIDITAVLMNTGQFKFNTVNGSCHLTVPADLNARVSAHGVNASVKCAQPTRDIEGHFGNWQGVIGQEDGPAAEITFHTVNGSLRIDTSSPVTAQAPHTAPMPPEPPAPPSKPPVERVEVKVAEPPPAAAPPEPEPLSQMDVLKMVENGELTVQEALDRLNQLKNP
jgi:hypothetical protein